MIKLSIITPYYKTLNEIKRLNGVLEPQLNENVEWIIIDDGCNEKELDSFNAIVIHLEENSGGASRPRNIGLEHATGEYIAFIDSDDMVTDNYISKIIKEIERNPDIIFLSWKSKAQQVIMKTQPPKWNCSVWCRVYKREIIGNARFDEDLRIAEDWKFNQQIKFKTKVCIKDIVYLYNNGRKGSLING